jgi:hypothetical protein
VLKSGAVISLEGYRNITQENAEKMVSDIDNNMNKAMSHLDKAMEWLETGVQGMGRELEKMDKALKF